MVPYQRPSTSGARPRAKSPAERADEFAGIQRRLKQEAAARRQNAPKTPKRPPGGRRRTP